MSGGGDPHRLEPVDPTPDTADEGLTGDDVCPTCHGSGRTDDGDACLTCGGSGAVEVPVGGG